MRTLLCFESLKEIVDGWNAEHLAIYLVAPLRSLLLYLFWTLSGLNYTILNYYSYLLYWTYDRNMIDISVVNRAKQFQLFSYQRVISDLISDLYTVFSESVSTSDYCLY